jgi:PPM family protein phosphatase
VHVVERSLRESDALLLCSDGLHNVVQPAMMLQIISASPNVDSAAQALVDKAIDLGTRDNATALVIRNEGDR